MESEDGRRIKLRVALTGHRPQRLGLPEDELDIKWSKIGHWIMNQILDIW